MKTPHFSSRPSSDFDTTLRDGSEIRSETHVVADLSIVKRTPNEFLFVFGTRALTVGRRGKRERARAENKS